MSILKRRPKYLQEEKEHYLRKEFATELLSASADIQ